MYFSLLLAITLGSGLLLHGVASLIVLAAWRIFHSRLEAMSPRAASRWLLTMRMSPLVISLVVLAVFVVPAFLEYEPRATSERVSSALLALAAIALFVLSASAVRCFAALLQSRRVMKEWLGRAQLQSGCIEGVRVYRCNLDTPVIAVMGMNPTRIFASDAIFNALTPDELQAALRHEAVHARSFDILKKLFLQLAPSLLPGVDLLKPVSAHWSRMCELSADEEAVTGESLRTLHLASALVKVARLAQPSPSPDLPTLSAALLPRKESLLKHRVRRLLEISEQPSATVAQNSLDLRRVLLAAGFLMALAIAAYPQVLIVTHELLEFLVRG